MSAERIVVFDQSVALNSPAGSCVLAELKGLRETVPLTVISSRCDIAAESGVQWLPIPLPSKPLVARYVVFQLLALLRYGFWRLRNLRAKVWIQTTQGQFVWADVAYAHFCHRAYLQGAWKASSVRGLKRVARRINHTFNAFFEGMAFRRARVLVVPSQGLAREISATYPACAQKISVISNPVDLKRFARPEAYDRKAARDRLGVSEAEIVCAFVALGDFARKGLGVVIDALAQMQPEVRCQLRIVVVGGGESEIAEFTGLARNAGVDDRLVFVGLQKDVCPYLWMADVFAFPSAYEIFSLAILQAAAAGLPVLVPTGLYGAEEFVVDGDNGWLVERSPDGVALGLSRVVAARERLPTMAGQAVASVQRYSAENFAANWRALYQRMGS